MRKYSIVHSVRVCTEFVPETFGRLTTLGPVFKIPCGRKQARIAFVVCACECGSIETYREPDLRFGYTASCGCLCRQLASSRAKTHGMSKTPEYRVWGLMKDRCTNPNCEKFEYYGGRGINYCGRWEQFENFLADMGLRPSPLHTLERDDTNGDYEPSNCRWATRDEQANNKRNNHLITIGNETKTFSRWCSHFAIGRHTVYHRIQKMGWNMEKALSTPTNRKPK